MTLSADFGLRGIPELKLVTLLHLPTDRYGFSAKEFEVIGWRFASDQDAGDLRVNLTLRETSSSCI